MRYLAFFALILACGFALASANDCLMYKCPTELDACSKDMTCAQALHCSYGCSDSGPECTRACAEKASCNAAFKNMTSCGAQCLVDAPAQVLELVADHEREMVIMSKCNIIKKAECAVGVAAAISSCGGIENISCIIERLKALHGCGKCFCQSIKCKGLCKNFC